MSQLYQGWILANSVNRSWRMTWRKFGKPMPTIEATKAEMERYSKTLWESEHLRRRQMMNTKIILEGETP